MSHVQQNIRKYCMFTVNWGGDGPVMRTGRQVLPAINDDELPNGDRKPLGHVLPQPLHLIAVQTNMLIYMHSPIVDA